jgi:hypothetical protein
LGAVPDRTARGSWGPVAVGDERLEASATHREEPLRTASLILAELRQCRASVTAVRCGTFVTMAGPSFRRRRAARCSRQVVQSCIATDSEHSMERAVDCRIGSQPFFEPAIEDGRQRVGGWDFGHLADAGRADVGFSGTTGSTNVPTECGGRATSSRTGGASTARYTAGRRSPSLSSRHGDPVGSQPAVRRSSYEERCGSRVSNRERRFDVDAGAGDAALVSADGRVRGIVELLVGVGDVASSVRRISRPSRNRGRCDDDRSPPGPITAGESTVAPDDRECAPSGVSSGVRS